MHGSVSLHAHSPALTPTENASPEKDNVRAGVPAAHLPGLPADGQQGRQGELLCPVSRGHCIPLLRRCRINQRTLKPRTIWINPRTPRSGSCDGGAKVGMPRQGPVEPLAKSLSASIKDQTRASSPTSSRGGDEDGDSLDALLEADMPNGTDRASALGLGSRPDTPPTPVQPHHQPPSPELAPLNALPDPQVAAARRAQSDRASTLIGQNLLKGWALLDTQCENESCYAVPLMRRAAPRPKKSDNEDAHKDGAPAPPKAIDPRRYCVICGRDYVREDDVGAYEAFMQAMRGGAAASSQQPAGSKNSVRGTAEPEEQVHSAAAKKRRFSSQPSTSAGRTKLASSVPALAALPSSITSKGKGRADTIAVSGLLDEHRTSESRLMFCYHGRPRQVPLRSARWHQLFPPQPMCQVRQLPLRSRGKWWLRTCPLLVDRGTLRPSPRSSEQLRK